MPDRSVVLVTGANGFVGRHLVPTLRARGHRVRCALRQGGTASAAEDTIVAVGAISGSTNWDAALAPDPDGCPVQSIVHLAGPAHGRNPGGPGAVMAAIRDGTLSFAQAAARSGVDRFVYVSSLQALTDAGFTDHVVNDDTREPLDSAYGLAKRAAEDELAALGRPDGMCITSLRPPLVYGPGVKGNLAKLVRLADLRLPLPLGGHTGARDLIGVGNLCDAITHCMSSKTPLEGGYLVTDGVPLTIGDMVRLLRAARGRPASLLPSQLLLPIRRLPGVKRTLDRMLGPMQVDDARFRVAAGWTPPFHPHDTFAASAQPIAQNG